MLVPETRRRQLESWPVDSLGMLDYERLDVYKCAIEHLGLVLGCLKKLKRGNAAIADQWRRAAMSVPLNIGEAAGKVSLAERSHCYQIARGAAMGASGNIGGTSDRAHGWHF